MPLIPRLAIDLFEAAKELEGYGSIPDEVMLPLSEEGLRYLVMVTLFEARPEPSSEQLPALREILAQRARLGVPLAMFLFHVQRAQHAYFEVVTDAIARLRLGPDVMSIATKFLMTFTVALVREATSVYRDLEIEEARHDEHRRSRVLFELLIGNPTAISTTDLEVYGLAENRAYSAARGLSIEPQTTERLRTHVETAAPTGLVGVLDGKLAAILPQETLDTLTGLSSAVLAIGPTGPLRSLRGSYRLAERLLEAGSRAGLARVVTLANLRLTLPIAHETELGQHLVTTYLAPLGSLSDGGGSVRETVRAYLVHRFSVEAAARALHVHVNTVRYRLRRFEELTGAELGSFSDCVNIWWALEWERLSRAGETRTPPAGPDRGEAR